MARSLSYRPAAEADILNIYDSIADFADPQSANRITCEIRERCERLTDFPEQGTPRDDLRPGIRTVVIGKAVIAYRLENEDVVVVHIRYGGQEMRPERLD